MEDEKIQALKLHSAGAIVQHSSPFEDLKPFRNDSDLTQDFINKWIIPFYMNIGKTDTKWINQLTNIKPEITPEIIQKSLGDFNWRTRQTGAFFCAITNSAQFIDLIGMHLLKSEVCYAGRVYCLVLASFNLPKCIEYLNLYLEYYLKRPDLFFDQREAMEAVMYLDKINATNYLDNHINNWSEFIQNRSNWDNEINCDRLAKNLAFIETVKAHIC